MASRPWSSINFRRMIARFLSLKKRKMGVREPPLRLSVAKDPLAGIYVSGLSNEGLSYASAFWSTKCCLWEQAISNAWFSRACNQQPFRRARCLRPTCQLQELPKCHFSVQGLDSQASQLLAAWRLTVDQQACCYPIVGQRCTNRSRWPLQLEIHPPLADCHPQVKTGLRCCRA